MKRHIFKIYGAQKDCFMRESSNRNFTIRIYAYGSIEEHPWNGGDRISIGNKPDDSIYIPFPEHIELYTEYGLPVAEYVSSNGTMHCEIEDMTVFPVSGINASVVIVESHSYFAYTDISKIESLTIGRVNSDLTLAHKSVSRRHALIFADNGCLYIEDCGSSNGTYVNNKLISEKTRLEENDIITIGKYTLIYFDSVLLKTDVAANSAAKIINDEFNRAPRLEASVSEEVIEIKKPPAIGAKPQMNWLSVILPPISMALIAVLMALMIGISPTYMLIMIPMQLISVVIAVVNYRKQKSEHSQLDKARDEKYKKYLGEIDARLKSAAGRQLNELIRSNPATAQCPKILEQRSTSLWERRTSDKDFALFRIGTGRIRANVSALWVKNDFAFSEDPLEDMADTLSKGSRYIDDAPILIGAGGNNIIGIAGTKDSAFSLVSNIVVQATTFHSYEDMRIAFIFSDEDSSRWNWVRWLPHAYEEHGRSRMLSYTKAGASSLMATMSGVLKERTSTDFLSSSNNVPHYLLIILSPELFADRKFLSELNSADTNVNISVIFAGTSVSNLPKECGQIIEIRESRGACYEKSNAANKTEFVLDDNSPIDFERFSRMMAPLKFSENGSKKTLPDAVKFMEGYGIQRISDYDIKTAWDNARMDKTMAVPIGIDEHGSIFNFDIMDGKHGVHGLVGGMPGSGKSEMLQSWILSMALNFSPADISFVLIDFKGTGLITPFLSLPHLAGTISNIDTDIKRNLEALKYEISRREQLFDKYKVQKIKDYNKKANQGEIPEKLPIVFVVIDEFAEFRKTFPEFMKWVESSFAKGRSLGIWFILATQNPGADASPSIKENTHFKWCLKVASPASSKEMTGIPDAAAISNPGRAFIRVNNSTADLLTEVQSFWSGAPYSESGDTKSEKIFMVAADGSKYGLENAGGTHATYSAISEINVIVSYISRFAKENHIPFAKRIWPDKLKDRIFLNELYSESFDGFSWPEADWSLSPIVGEVDDPMHQRKYPLELAFPDFGHLAVYGAPSSGKTTFIESLVMSMAMMYPPSHVNIYLMDFGGLGLRALEKLPHVGGLVESGNDEFVEKLAYLLGNELETRKAKFADIGVGSIKSYNELCPDVGEKLPYIVLAADNFNSALKEYPELESMFGSLLQSGANYGIYCVLVSTGINGISYRLQQNIKMNIALQLADKSDYAMVVGRTENLVPDNIVGRGLLKGNPPLQFQTALPAEGKTSSEITQNIRNIAADMKNSWKGQKTPCIPIMPEKIEYGSVTGTGAVIGLSHKDISPVSYRFEDQHYMMISFTEKRSGINLLKVLAEQLDEKLSGSRILIDTSGSSFSDISKDSDVVLSSPEEIDDYIEKMRPELQRRSGEAERSHEPFTPIIILVDDYCRFYSIISNETANRIRAIVVRGAGMGLYFLAACDAQELSVLKNRGELATVTMTKGCQSVLLGGCMNDHPAYQVRADYGQKKTVVKSNEGFLLSENGFVRFKAMEF